MMNCVHLVCVCVLLFSGVAVLYSFFFQAEDGIRYLVRSRGLGDVYKRQIEACQRQLPELLMTLRSRLRRVSQEYLVTKVFVKLLSLIHI